MLVAREMTDLEGDVWDDPVDLVLRILVINQRTGVPIFQAGWSDCMYFSLSLFVSFAHLEFTCM
jgi:hypothetical protein